MSEATTPRKRRVGASVGLILVALLFAGALAWWLDARAERNAAVAAANDEVRAAIAQRYDEMEVAAANGADAAASLRLTLQEHLTVSDRSDDELAADRTDEQAALRSAGDRLAMLASQPEPELPELADERALADDLDRLEELADRSVQLADRFRTVAVEAGNWADALGELRAQADRYVETVEGQPETHDPEELVQLWEEERAVLADYRRAAEAAEDVEGLRPIAEAYLDYIERNVGFVDEAVGLLQEERIEEYNRRLEDAFGGEDPFGFRSAVAEATQRSLQLGVIRELAEVRTDALDLVVELQEAEADASPSPAAGTDPSP